MASFRRPITDVRQEVLMACSCICRTQYTEVYPTSKNRAAAWKYFPRVKLMNFFLPAVSLRNSRESFSDSTPLLRSDVLEVAEGDLGGFLSGWGL